MFKQADYDAELDRYYDEFAEGFTQCFMSKMFNDGIIQDISNEDLVNYLSNHDNYIDTLEKMANYLYITDGNVFQLFDLTKVLPSLNYRIECYSSYDDTSDDIALLKKTLRNVKHKQLTRDIIQQEVATGTVVGIWLNEKNKPYLYLFDDLELAYPAYRLNGEWQVVIDMSVLSSYTEAVRQRLFQNLQPYLTQQIYNKYQQYGEGELLKLPIERTICLRTHTLKRSQPYGVNWSTPGLYAITHKKKLRDLEKAVANKIITSVAVLTIGTSEQSGLKMKKSVKKNIFNGVKKALEATNTKGVPVISLPEVAKLEFPELKYYDALNPEKFQSSDKDITSAFGVSQALLNGTESNYASAKLNLDIIYKKIAVLLEDIEIEVYQKLFDLILSDDKRGNYGLIYQKNAPITTKEKIDYLIQLHNTQGFSLKAVIDLIGDIDFDEYVEQSIYEQEFLKLPEKIKPYANAYTLPGDTGSEQGAPENTNDDNENTVKSKTSDGNSLPRG
jgi:hypothetical protein